MTFNANGGKINASDEPLVITVTKGQSVQEPKDPVWAGHTFLYWHEQGVTDTYAFGSAVVKDTTLVAEWGELKSIDYRTISPNSVSIQDATVGFRGATMPQAPDTYMKGVETAINNPTWDGYIFKGWLVYAKNGDSTSQIAEGAVTGTKDGNLYKNLKITSSASTDIALYACWETTEKNVEFDWNPNSVMITRSTSTSTDNNAYSCPNDLKTKIFETRTVSGNKIKHNSTYGANVNPWPEIDKNTKIYGYYFGGWSLWDGDHYVCDIGKNSTVDLTDPILAKYPTVKLKAKWALEPVTRFEIKYYRPKLGTAANAALNDTYYIVDTEVSYRPSDQNNSFNCRQYTGFSLATGEESQKTISANGTTNIVRFAYKRNVHSINGISGNNLQSSYIALYKTENIGSGNTITPEIKEISATTEIPYMDRSIDGDACVMIYCAPTAGYKITGYKMNMDESATKTEFKLAQPIVSGNMINGSYVTENGTVTSKALQFRMPDNDVDFEVLTEGINYTIRYHLDNNGNIATSSATYGDMDKVKLLSIQDALRQVGIFANPDGIHFTGWAKTSDGDVVWGEKIKEEDRYTAATDTLANANVNGNVSISTVPDAVEFKDAANSRVGGLTQTDNSVQPEGSVVDLYAKWDTNMYTLSVDYDRDVKNKNRVYNITNALDGTINERYNVKIPVITSIEVDGNTITGSELSEKALRKDGDNVYSMRVPVGATVQVKAEPSGSPSSNGVYVVYVEMDEKWTYDDNGEGYWGRSKNDGSKTEVKSYEACYWHAPTAGGTAAACLDGENKEKVKDRFGYWTDDEKLAHFDGDTTSYGDTRFKNSYTYGNVSVNSSIAFTGPSAENIFTAEMPANPVTAAFYGSCFVTLKVAVLSCSFLSSVFVSALASAFSEILLCRASFAFLFSEML